MTEGEKAFTILIALLVAMCLSSLLLNGWW